MEAPSQNRLNHHCMTSHWHRPFQPSDSLDLALLERRYVPATLPFDAQLPPVGYGYLCCEKIPSFL